VSLAFDGHARTVRDSSRSRAEPRDDTLIDLLPNTICSVFSTRGEYPAQKAGNARGLRHTSLYDIAALYGRHHYNIGSLSAGLSRLVSPGFEAARRALATLAGLHVGTDVKVFPTQRLTRQALASVPEFLWRSEQTWDFEQAEWSRLRQHLPWLATDWIPVDPEVLQAEADGLVYINDVVLTSANSRRFSLMTLSAGQKMLLVRLLSILSKVSDDSLVILEEPELHLDPLWCGSLLELLGAFFGRFRAHLVVTTQNLSVMRCFPAQTVIAMNDGRPSPLHQRTFLASEAVVADLVYRGQALSTLDELVLARLAGLGDLSNRESAVALLGEGPVRFLARRAVADSGRS